MKFSKTTFFSAALLLAGACVASAAKTINVSGDQAISVNSQMTENYHVGKDSTLTLTIKGTHTLYGRLLGSTSRSDRNVTWQSDTLASDYANGHGYYDIDEKGGKIEITGGGTLKYNGFDNITYYSETYITENGREHGSYEQNYTSSLIGINSDGNVATGATAFSGQLTISDGTTFVVGGYLSQYVEYATPKTETHSPGLQSLGYVGISNLILKDDSTISFASAEKNLLSESFELGDVSNGRPDTAAPEGAEGVRRLNFLHNVKADINSTIILGEDEESASRIVIETAGTASGTQWDRDYGWDGEATIGILSGTGRVYLTSSSYYLSEYRERGTVSVTNRAEFATLKANAVSTPTILLNVESEKSVLNYVGNLSNTHNLRGKILTNRETGDTEGVLADVFLLTHTNLGTDSSGKNVVDNVLETATAVQLESWLGFGDASGSVDGGTIFENRSDYVGSYLRSREAGSVTIAGTQILNNLQSLFVERESLWFEQREGGYYELEQNTLWRAYLGYASNTGILVKSGSTLIINQLEDRDGDFRGRFYATDATIEELKNGKNDADYATLQNDGYVIKTGAGTFANVSSLSGSGTLPLSLINRLFIYDGKWVSDAQSLGSGRVYIGEKGSLLIVQNDTGTLNTRIEGTSKLVFSTDYTLVNDGEEYLIKGKSGQVQIMVSQDNFFGEVEVGENITLILGNAGDEGGSTGEQTSVFSNAEKITFADSSALKIASYQILPTLEAASDSNQPIPLIFTGKNYDAVAVLTGGGGNELDERLKISGSGTLVKTGRSTFALDFDDGAMHTLATVGLSGGLDLKVEGAVKKSSGVVLVGSNVDIDKNQVFGALIGGKNVNIRLRNGVNLTVGLDAERLLDGGDGDGDGLRDGIVPAINSYYENAGAQKIQQDAYYFATADKSRYLSSGEGALGLGNLLTGTKAGATIESLGAIRPDYLPEGETETKAFTVQQTIDYVKDPANFAEVFKRLYATIDDETFAEMSQSDDWKKLGIKATSIKGVFDSVLDLESVKAFVASTPQGWTERELNALETFAENYNGTRGGDVFVRDDDSLALPREGYQALLDANVIKYLATFGEGISSDNLQSTETFYEFISLFVGDYKFRLTEANIEKLEDVYGFEGIDGKTEAERYARFENLIGVQYKDGELPGFAGVILGEGASLTKIGSETLRLTGIVDIDTDTYSGSTIIRGGELRVEGNVIKQTSGVLVEAGALLTLVNDDAAETKRFVIGPAAVIRGEGTILKDGVGTLVIEAALATEPEDESGDFTGEIVVGNGALVINAGTRKEFKDSVNVYLNRGTMFELNVGVYETKNEAGEVVATNPHTLTFNGAILGGAPVYENGKIVKAASFVKSGGGVLVLSNGVAIADSANSYNLDVKEGELVLKLAPLDGDCNFRTDDSNNSSFKATLGKEAILTFDVKEGTTTKFAGAVDKEAGASGTTFRKTGAGELLLNKVWRKDDKSEEIDTSKSTVWTVDRLFLEAGTLQIAENSAYRFNQIETAEGSSLVVNGTLSVSGGNDFKGDLAGTGTLKKVGAEMLELSGISFSGTVELAEGGLTINVENGYKTLGFALTTSDNETSLVKAGAGTAVFAGSVDLKNTNLGVSEGTLVIDGTKLENAPKSIEIAKDATFKLSSVEPDFDLTTVSGGLRGAGTLALGAQTMSVSNAQTIKGFTGTFDVAQNAALKLGKGISAIGGIAGAGTVAFDENEKNITLAPNRDVVFTGTLETAGDARIAVAGSETLALAKKTKDANGNELVSKATLSANKFDVAGSLVVASEHKALDITLKQGGSLGIVGDMTGTSYGGNVSVANGVTEVGIVLEGDIRVSDVSSLPVKLGKYAGNVELSNMEGCALKLEFADDENDPASAARASSGEEKKAYKVPGNILLKANAGGTLGLKANSTYLYTECSADISGDGKVEKTGSGELRLTSAKQSYTGETIVSNGTLAFKTGTQLATSGITVRENATLQGGVTLTAKDAGVFFEQGSLYKLDVSKGESLKYTGTFEASGEMTLDIAVSQANRGTPIFVFDYIGKDVAPSSLYLGRFNLKSTGELLYIDTSREYLQAGDLVVYVAQDDFRKTGADLHDGIDELVDILSDWATPVGGKLKYGLSDEERDIADALNKTSLGDLGDAISNLSPLAYAAMISMPHSGFTSDVRSISSRLEQRLYDSAGAAWVYNREWEFFAQAQGSTVDGGSDADSMVYDYNTYGALAGADIKLSKETTLGFAVAYDHGKADIHGNGGEIESDNIRLTGFAGFMLNDYLALNIGAQVGYTDYEVERNTVLGKNEGDTDGLHGGVFADFVGAYTLCAWGESAHLDLLPHAGLAFSYYRVDEFEEISSRDDFGSALATDGFDALSLQARLGATLNCVFDIGGHTTRLGTDFSLVHEFLDDEVEIDSMLVNSEFKTDARAISGTSLSVAPSVSFDLDEKTTLYLNYEFRVGSESETAHSANLGFRHRF